MFRESLRVKQIGKVDADTSARNRLGTGIQEVNFRGNECATSLFFYFRSYFSLIHNVTITEPKGKLIV